MEYKEIENYTYERIKNKEFNSKGLSDIHTQMLIKCSSGDIAAKKYIMTMIDNILTEINIPKEEIKQQVANKIFSEKWGLKLLDKYNLNDVDEIIVIGKKILLKKQGDIIEVDEQFNDLAEVISIMRRSTEFDKTKDINELNPSVTAERYDGARIQITIPPLSRYPVQNIRKFDSFIPTTQNMLKSGTFTDKEIEIISTLVKGRANILVIGEPESGKTTTIKWLINYLHKKLIIGLLENDFEMNPEKLYPNKYFISLRKRDNYSLGDLFTILLQKSINLVIVTEALGSEAEVLIRAMTRGLDGSMGTAHITSADSVPDALTYMTMEGVGNIPFAAKRNQIADAIDIVIEMRKLPENKEGKMKKISGGIYEIIAKGENQRHETASLSRLIIDGENPQSSDKRTYENTISQKLRNKLNANGVKMSEIRRVFGDECV
nr:ATPase, T2SS/T4P/T4SS family [Sedimentibacter sp.]